MTNRAQLIHAAALPATCPPKHRLTQGRAVINRHSVGTEQLELYLVDILPGGEGEQDIHPDCDHGFFILQGKGEAQVEEERFLLEPDDCLFIPRGARHSVRPAGENTLRMIVFMAPHRPA
ncbi:MAG: cupin domain-containing protein [Telluria sp.]|nr:cupin domain-containing protein [Telluria sp.]